MGIKIQIPRFKMARMIFAPCKLRMESALETRDLWNIVTGKETASFCKSDHPHASEEKLNVIKKKAREVLVSGLKGKTLRAVQS